MTWALAFVALSFVVSILLGRFCALTSDPDQLVDEESA